jgi:hypothetical protein
MQKIGLFKNLPPTLLTASPTSYTTTRVQGRRPGEVHEIADCGLRIAAASVLMMACDESLNDWGQDIDSGGRWDDVAGGSDYHGWHVDAGIEGSAATSPAAETLTSEQFLIWRPSETWDSAASFRASLQVLRARAANYGYSVVSFLNDDGWACSGGLISRSRLVTAEHCNGGPAISPLFLVNDGLGLEIAEQRFRDLGFRPGTLTETAAVQSLTPGFWNCNNPQVDGTRDLVYYFCGERQFEAQPGYFVSLHPGEIFGHLDIQVGAPDNLSGVIGLTVNGRDGWPKQQVMLSPNGVRYTGLAQGCSPGYTNCASTQGDDTLGGSSGGVSVLSANTRTWGVANGHSYASGPDPVRTPMCWTGNTGGATNCAVNRNTWTTFTSLTAQLQYTPSYTSIAAAPRFDATSALGGSGGSPITHDCEFTDAMIGIVASVYADPWNPGTPVVLGNFGAVCAPVLNSSPNYLQLDYATVRTATSYDTDFQWSVDGGTYPPRLNRYISTILSDMGPTLAFSRQQLFVCPSGYAVAAIGGLTKFGVVRRLSSVTCRDVFPPYGADIFYSTDGRMGSTEIGSTFGSSSCPSGTFAAGASVRAGWFTDQIRLRCR